MQGGCAGAAGGKVSEGRWTETEWELHMLAFLSVVLFKSQRKDSGMVLPHCPQPRLVTAGPGPHHEVHTRSLADILEHAL